MAVQRQLIPVSGLGMTGSQAIEGIALLGYDYENQLWLPIAVDNLGNLLTSGLN